MRPIAVGLALLVVLPASAAAALVAPPAVEGSEGFVCDDPLVGPPTCGPARAMCALLTTPQGHPFRVWLVIVCSLLFGYCPPDVFC